MQKGDLPYWRKYFLFAAVFLCNLANAQSDGSDISGDAPFKSNNLVIVDSRLNDYVSTVSNRQEKGAVEVTANGVLQVSGSVFRNNRNGTSSTNGELVKPGAGVIYLNSGTQASIAGSEFSGNRDYYFNKVIGDKSAGAVFNAGNLKVDDSRFVGNTDNFAGGAITNYSDGNMTVSGSTFDGNGRVAGLDTRFGGAVMNYGTMTDSGSTYAGNSANTQGGAIVLTVANGKMPSLTVNGDVFRQNTSSHGGAIAVTGGTFSDTGSTYDGNVASYSGGAFRIYKGATGSVTNDVFSGNSATNTGGGAVFNAGILTDSGSVYTGNQGYSGGAVFNSGSLSASAGRFSGNSASVYGGAIYNSGSLTISDANFSGNSAKVSGGAIHNSAAGQVVLSGSSFFAGNTAGGLANDISNDGIFHFGSDSMKHVVTVLNEGVSGSGEMYLNQGILVLGQDRQIQQNSFHAGAGTVTYITLSEKHLVQTAGIKHFSELDDGVRNGKDKAQDAIGNSGFMIHTSGGMVLDKDAVLHVTIKDSEPGKTYLVAYNEQPQVMLRAARAVTMTSQGFSHEETAWKNVNLLSGNPMLEFARVEEDNDNGYVMVSSRASNAVGIVEDLGSLSHIYYGWLSDISDLRHRLGEVRYGAQDGVWGKVIYSRYHAKGLADSRVRTDDYSMHVGVDRLVGKGEDHSWLAGLSFRGGQSDMKAARYDGSADMDHYTLKAYGTYMNAKGSYADIVGAVGHFQTDFSGFHNERAGYMHGDFSNWGYGVSAETGHMLRWGGEADDRRRHDYWFFEPQFQLSFFHVDGRDYDTSNAIHVRQKDVDFLTGRIGGVLGKKFGYGGTNGPDERYMQIAGRAGWIHEFDGEQSLDMNGRRFTGNVADNVFYYGLDIDWQCGQAQKLYVQLDRAEGSGYRKDIQVRAGYRVAF